MPRHEEVDADYEYLDLSHHDMPYSDLIEVMEDLSGDNMLRQVDLGYMLKQEDASDPNIMEEIIQTLCESLEANNHLTALDFAGNHLGDFTPCAPTPHRKDYIKVLSNSLAKSPIQKLDISDNMILGPGRRILSSLTELLHTYVVKKCTVFRCLHNELHNQAWGLMSCLLGHSSILIELDLSDNKLGLDPFGNPNATVMGTMARLLGQTHSLKKLYLARNYLSNEDIMHISEAINKLPELNFLDISGNLLHESGVYSLAEAIQGHANLRGRQGLKTLLLGSNPIRSGGLEILSAALKQNDTISLLDISDCGFRSDAISHLVAALKENSTLLFIDISRNKVTKDKEELVHAEVEANNCVVSLTNDIHSVDASTISLNARKALEKKLRFIPQGVLQLLHHNPSINDPMTDIQDELYLLAPPDRHTMMQKVGAHSSTINARLALSGMVGVKVRAHRIIFNAVLKWYRKVQFHNKLQADLGIVKTKSSVAKNKYKSKKSSSRA